MREQYATDGPGKYEGQPPIVRFLWENDTEDESWEYADEYMARCGRWLIHEDSRGFVTGRKFATATAAYEAGGLS